MKLLLVLLVCMICVVIAYAKITFEKIDSKSFKRAETKEVIGEEIYTKERLIQKKKHVLEHIGHLEEKLVKANEDLVKVNELIAEAKKLGIDVEETKGG